MTGKAWYDPAITRAPGQDTDDDGKDILFINGKLVVNPDAKGTTTAIAGLMSVLSKVYGGGNLKLAESNIIVNSVQMHSAHWDDVVKADPQIHSEVQRNAGTSHVQVQNHEISPSTKEGSQAVAQQAANVVQKVAKPNVPVKPPHRDVAWSPLDEMPATGSAFDPFLVVHKSKPLLEKNRPNPYSQKLPTVMQAFLPDNRRNAYLERALDTTHEKVQKEVDLLGLGFLRDHPEWGSELFRRQWHLETRCVDIGVARYFETAHKSCLREAGADLPVVQRILFEWFHGLTEVILREQVRSQGPYLHLPLVLCMNFYAKKLLLSPYVLSESMQVS
jgi:hypothetical protein